jgi:imidazole glycerol phosphate synthase subunit HisF
MKTAMQELIEIIKFYEEECVDEDIKIGLTSAKNMAKDMIEKEKEQMFYWFYGGGGLSATDDFREEFEKNYNQTYNQNK